MKCEVAQNALWYSEITEEVRSHLLHCKTCQSEQQKVQPFFSLVDQSPIPIPTRSLVPSTQELQRSLRFYKQRRLQKWLIRAAAVACVAVAVTQAPALIQHQSPQQGATTATTHSNSVTIPASSTQDLDKLTAIRDYLLAHLKYPATSHVQVLAFKQDTRPSETTASGLVLLNVDGKQQSQYGSFTKVNGVWQLVSLTDVTVQPVQLHHVIPVTVKADSSPYNDAIQAYLSKRFYDQKGIQQVEFDQFTPDPATTTDPSTITGTVSLTLQMEKGAPATFVNGPLQTHVTLSKQQTGWTVVDTTGIPDPKN